MGTDIFKNLGVNVAKIVNDALGKSLLPATLTKSTPGTRLAGNIAAGTQPTNMDHSCRGFIDETMLKRLDKTTVKAGDKVVAILGDSLPVGIIPESADTILIEGDTLSVVEVLERDPAAAMYLVHTRGA